MLITDGIYHILNRGIEDRIIFQTKRDYERFLLTVFECNSTELVSRNRFKRASRKVDNYPDRPDPLVEILCFSLMPNHFHMAMKQLVDGGIAKFMQRIGDSYTKYFNIKYGRKGSLFMARYKSVYVSTDSQLRHLITYIHANSLDLSMSEWREGKLRNFKKAKEFLENYTWSSYLFYSGIESPGLIPEIINKEIADIFYPKKEDYFKAICSWSNRYFEDFSNLE